MKQIKELIEKHTTEEGIDFAGLEETLNQEVNNIVAKNVGKAEAGAFKGVIEGIETKEDLLKHIESLKMNTTDQVKQLEKSLEEATKAIQEKEAALSETSVKVQELNKTTDILQRERILLEQGITDPEDRDYLLYNVGKLVNEEIDFNQAWEKYREEKADKVERFLKPTQVVQSTGTKIRGGSEASQLTGVKALIRERNKDVFTE